MKPKPRSLFTEQEEAEDKIIVDGVRLHPSHLLDYRKLRRVLAITAEEAQALIEKWDTIECICAQACIGNLTPVALGRLVNQKWLDLTTD